MDDLLALVQILLRRESQIALIWIFAAYGLAWMIFGRRALTNTFAASIGLAIGLWLCIKLGREEYFIRYSAAGLMAGCVFEMLYDETLIVCSSLTGGALLLVAYALMGVYCDLPKLGETGVYISLALLTGFGWCAQVHLPQLWQQMFASAWMAPKIREPRPSLNVDQRLNGISKSTKRGSCAVPTLGL
jgi:hypothetical protein